MEDHGGSPDSQCDVFLQEDIHGNLWSYGVDILSGHVEETVMNYTNEVYSCHHATVRREGNGEKKGGLMMKVLILVHYGNPYQVRGVSFVLGESEEKLKVIAGRMNKMICNRQLVLKKA